MFLFLLGLDKLTITENRTMIIPYATSLVRDAGDRDSGIQSAFRFLESVKLKPDERDYAKSEIVKIADKLYSDCSL